MVSCGGQSRILFRQLYRHFRTAACGCQKRNHYDVLGITPKATQNQIKSAYYKLSMIYHPDKNKDSTKALAKFRDITEAYEVLGNYKLRKLYDKGIIHTSGHRMHGADVDDAETRFYKSRQYRHQAPPSEGAAPIYNFDEWTKSHYGRAFERRQNVKTRYEERMAHELRTSYDSKVEKVIAGIFTGTLILFLLWPNEDFDAVNTSDGDRK